MKIKVELESPIMVEVKEPVWVTIDSPFICVTSEKPNGWSICVTQPSNTNDENFFDLIEEMQNAIDCGGAEDDSDMIKAIGGVKKLLSFLEKRYTRDKDPKSISFDKIKAAK